MPKSKPRLIHMRYWEDAEQTSARNRGGVTIAYHLLDNGHAFVAFSRCSDKDNFCKKTGRNIAIGRLQSGHCWHISVGEDYYGDIINWVTNYLWEPPVPPLPTENNNNVDEDIPF
jgi:hypothetical protein